MCWSFSAFVWFLAVFRSGNKVVLVRHGVYVDKYTILVSPVVWCCALSVVPYLQDPVSSQDPRERAKQRNNQRTDCSVIPVTDVCRVPALLVLASPKKPEAHTGLPRGTRD